ncbi:hypothetical protein PHYSODRAFT_485789 [Phytophthora sojae]|uniref:Uncharacterized protein n=1 Tax=Phytophthora sojae (strain P6497) TaxID=1094619 RepID=G4YVB8_PHYSP|nr:hypothetical protein PHYSODRAFT_485789 [Phytophthora sojae]EGZ26488.1 hypothetical protein PHYSODRAFT_485789 [Phytophthora sojae]|eukprot:XP_009521776.1 hypothetical protein PHYSODRAFT_485789 [Phytophthora sojae]
MGLEELEPGNTKRAKATAVAAFQKFLKSEDVGDEYVHAALLCLLWYLFGRASDLALLRKQNVSIDAGEVLFVRFIRMKTSEEQGLSLFPDPDFATCLLLAMALAIITQTAPSPDVINNLPERPSQVAVELSPDVPLLEMLDHPITTLGLAAPTSAGLDTTPTIYTHVNRVLDRISKPAGVVAVLTSHSFRRGGAQHANASGSLTARWIFDRGAWNMTTTNKGFNYIFNTSEQDHKILSGRDAEAKVPIQQLKAFDSQTRTKIDAAQRLLFAACQDLETARYNVNQPVLDVLTACVLRHYLVPKELNPEAAAIKRIEACVVHGGSSIADLLAWSTHLASAPANCNKKASTTEQPPTQPSKPIEDTEAQKIIRHQAAVINHFIEHSQRQDARMDALEAKLHGDPAQATAKRNKPDSTNTEASKPKKKQRRSSATHLHATWFAWYAQEPRMWQAAISKQQKSDAKLLVAFMKLFLEGGFALDSTAPDYRDRVLDLGKRAEEAILRFLAERDITSRGSGAVLKHLRALHRSGDLNAKIERHQRLLQPPTIRDPAPGYTQDVLEVVSQ